eukprot:11492603-Alexandrium_andersonii.AAC.1
MPRAPPAPRAPRASRARAPITSFATLDPLDPRFRGQIRNQLEKARRTHPSGAWSFGDQV